MESYGCLASAREMLCWGSPPLHISRTRAKSETAPCQSVPDFYCVMLSTSCLLRHKRYRYCKALFHYKCAYFVFQGEVELVMEGNAQYVSNFECSDALDLFYSFEPSKAEISTLLI